MRGFSQYDESAHEASISLFASDMYSPDADDKIHVQDPVLIFVQCNQKVFLAVFQILALRLDSKNLQSISSNKFHEPNVRIHGQVMKLALLDAAHQPGGIDWEWSGTFEACSTFQNAEG